MVQVKKQNNFFFQNRNTRLISVEIWASPGMAVLVVEFTKVWDARCRHRGWFKTRLSFFLLERKLLGLELHAIHMLLA